MFDDCRRHSSPVERWLCGWWWCVGPLGGRQSARPWQPGSHRGRPQLGRWRSGGDRRGRPAAAARPRRPGASAPAPAPAARHAPSAAPPARPQRGGPRYGPFHKLLLLTSLHSFSIAFYSLCGHQNS